MKIDNFISSDNYHYIHRLSKRTIPFLKKNNRFTEVLSRNEKNNDINTQISEIILKGEPSMIARYGSTESRAIVNFNLQLQNLSDYKAILKSLSGDINLFWKKDEKFLDNLINLSGFFPKDDQQLKKFVDLMKECTRDLNILGVWNGYEEFMQIPEDTKLCKIRELEPWFYDNSWTYALKNKKVLVIHPFENSIKSQYSRRKNLYKNPKILPDFDLKTIKAVQTIAGQKSEFCTWFDALEAMQKKIKEIDFDVAIIGCGAYGFPLASYVKSLGKIGIHLGGVTQLLFGIKGKRWEEWEHYRELRKEDGQFWIKASEIPIDYKKIEGGCYW